MSQAVSGSGNNNKAYAGGPAATRWWLSTATMAVVGLSIVVAVLSLWSIDRLREDARWVAHTEEVISALGQVLVLTVDTETAQRGFVLTGDPAYLQPYREATRTLTLELDRLRRLVADNPVQSRRFAELQPLCDQRISLVDALVDLQVSKGAEAARLAVAAGEGKRVQDAIRALVADMRHEEHRLLAVREAASALSARLAMGCIALGALLTVAVSLRFSRQVQARNAALQRASALKSEFLASMSHEIRTPMNAIVGLTQLLSRQTMSDEQQDMVRRIAAAGRSLMAIINDILDLSKIEAGHLRLDARSFALSPLLMHLSSLLGPAAREKSIVLRFELPSQSLDVGLVGDPQRLEQVLVNLIGNAVKFTEQGEVVVRTRVAAQDARQVRLRFEVQDTGIGISAGQLEQLFQPFTQADTGLQRRHAGTGLGLSIAKRLVDLMNGRIGAHSTLGVGSTFWFEVPFARGDGADAQMPVYAQPPVAAAQPRLRGLHLLTVDDNETNLDLVERALRLEGADSTPARDGQQAVQALRAHAGRFDAMLLDLQMPVMDGITATRVVRQELGLHALPIIIFSASVLPQEREQAMAAGATDFLPKPVDIEELVAVLTRHRPGPPRPPAAEPVSTPAPTPALALLAAPAQWPPLDGMDGTLVRKALGDDFAHFMRLSARLEAQAEGALAEVPAALARGDAAAALRTLHALRGAALSLGATRLAAAIVQLEQSLRDGEAADDALRALQSEFAALQRTLAPWAYLRRPPPPHGA